MEWQLLKTVPSEPMGVLLYTPGMHCDGIQYGQDYGVEVGFWDGRQFCEQGTGHAIDERLDFNPMPMPTHWHPLPAPPTTSGEEGRR